MIDGTSLMIAGVIVQTVIPARALLATFGPRLRGPGMLAAIAFAPLPYPPLAAHSITPTTVASER